MTSSSTGVPKTGSGYSRDAASGWKPDAEVGAEEVVHDRQHLRPRAVVQRQRERVRRGVAALAEDADVGVAEAVDRLELVPDEEDLALVRARSASRSISSHWRRFVSWNSSTMIERKRSASRSRISGRSRSRSRARSWRSSKSSADSRSFASAYASAKPASSSCSSSRSRCGQLVQGGVLERLARLLVRRGAFAARTQVAQVDERLRTHVELERGRRCGALRLGGAGVADEALSRVAQLREALVDARPARRARGPARGRPSAASRRRS